MQAMGNDVAAVLSGAVARLGSDARPEAEILLAHALDRPRAWLYAHADDAVPAAARTMFEAMVARRSAGEPVALLTGRQGFWSLDLLVTPDVLIPRADTELLVECALAVLPADMPCRVADLGTGSGAIALAIASERLLAQIVAIDASVAALDVAVRNAEISGLSSRVRCIRGDWLASLKGERFDAIVSNPPYLADDDPHLKQGDLRYEPRRALVSGSDGLDAIRAIVGDAPAHLLPDGWLLLEHGCEQGAAVRALLEAAGFEQVATQRDIEARERVTGGIWRQQPGAAQKLKSG